MGDIRFPSARVALAAGSLLLLFGTAAAPLRDAPVSWYADDRKDIAEPEERDPSLLWDGPQASVVRPFGRLTNPGRLVRRVGTLFGGDHVPPAANVNALDETPNSSWFTNRIGLFPMTPGEAALGPGAGMGPDRSGPWTVTGAKTEGVTPGFRIRDPLGDTYLIKFDPPRFEGMASAAAVISGKILHASGYNVPEDGIVTFAREDLVLGEGVEITLEDGEERPMTEADIDRILAEVAVDEGPIRAIASKYLSGKPVGPFDWQGRREDDPNDTINHDYRRELRGLRVIAGWINHFDTKQQNTLDMFVEESGRHYVRHHLIDFASSLGAGATGPEPAYGFEYTLDFPATAGRCLALGITQDAWRKLERPDLPEIGYFESEQFDPMEFKPLTPNAAYANLTDRDAYWGAKIVSAFTDEHLAAIVETGRYRDPAAAAYMVRTLAERRDKIARTWFDRVPPLDFFRFEGGVLRFHDLGEERGIYPGTTPRYRVRIRTVDENRNGRGWSDWRELDEPRVDAAAGVMSIPVGGTGEPPFLEFELQVNRGSGWSGSVHVFAARGSGRVVAVER